MEASALSGAVPLSEPIPPAISHREQTLVLIHAVGVFSQFSFSFSGFMGFKISELLELNIH